MRSWLRPFWVHFGLGLTLPQVCRLFVGAETKQEPGTPWKGFKGRGYIGLLLGWVLPLTVHLVPGF